MAVANTIKGKGVYFMEKVLIGMAKLLLKNRLNWPLQIYLRENQNEL